MPPDYAYLQIQAFLLMSTLTLSYILLVRPQEGGQGVWVEAVNEGAVMCAGIHLVVFGGLVREAEVLWAAGWSLVGVIILNLLVNILVISYSLWSDIKKLLVKLTKGCVQLRVFSRHVKKFAIARTSMRRRNLYSSALHTSSVNDLSTVSQNHYQEEITDEQVRVENKNS